MKRWKVVEADADDESALTSRELRKIGVAFKDLSDRDPTSLEFYRPTWMKLVPAIDAAIDDMNEGYGTD